MLIVFAMDSMFFARRQTTWLRRWTRFLHTLEHGMHPLDSAIFFTEMGLTLYRSRVFTEKVLEEEWFLAQSLDAQEDDRRFFYFETVSAGEWSYDERLKESGGTRTRSRTLYRGEPCIRDKEQRRIDFGAEKKAWSHLGIVDSPRKYRPPLSGTS